MCSKRIFRDNGMFYLYKWTLLQSKHLTRMSYSNFGLVRKLNDVYCHIGIRSLLRVETSLYLWMVSLAQHIELGQDYCSLKQTKWTYTLPFQSPICTSCRKPGSLLVSMYICLWLYLSLSLFVRTLFTCQYVCVFVCDLHVICMWFECDLHVICMWFSCDLHVIYMWFTCDLNVIWMWFECNLNVIYIWFEYDVMWCDVKWCDVKLCDVMYVCDVCE